MLPIDRRRFSPACGRNRDPILSVLSRFFPSSCRILEIASGTGEHGAYFAAAHPNWRWQPSDFSRDALESISAWADHMGLTNLQHPIQLDVTQPIWPIEQADAIYCANMIHISPWSCTLGLLDGAARVLTKDQHLITYGPYKFGGKHTATSNSAFHQNLKARDPNWGIRDVDRIQEEAIQRGLQLTEVSPMPANNFCLVFMRQ